MKKVAAKKKIQNKEMRKLLNWGNRPTFLFVPYAEKDEVKYLPGVKWNSILKTWYVT